MAEKGGSESEHSAMFSPRVMFHQNEKRTLKHLPLSLIRDSFPFGFQGKRAVR